MKRAFTLIELLIVVTILGGILVAITQLLATSLSGSGKSQALQLVKENGQFAISVIEQTSRRAERITACTTAGTTGTLAVAVPESSGTVTYTFQGGGGGALTKDSGSGTVNLISSDVRVVSFSCSQPAESAGNPMLATLSLVLDKPSSDVDRSVVSQTFQTTISLRTY